MASLRADVDYILEMRGAEPETAPVELAENTMFPALFSTPTAPPHEPCKSAKRHHSILTSEGEDARARKKERIDIEDASRASLTYKETRQMRARELAVGNLVPYLKLLRGEPLRVQILFWAPLRVTLLLRL